MMEQDNLMQKVGSRLKVLRTERGLTQEAVAEQLNISLSAYARMERGEIEMTIQRLEAVANLFGKNIIDMLELTGMKASHNFNSNSHFENNQVYQGNLQFPAVSQEAHELLKKQVETLDIAVQRLVRKLEQMEGKLKS